MFYVYTQITHQFKCTHSCHKRDRNSFKGGSHTVETADLSWYPLPLARKVRSEGSPLFKGPHRFRMIWDATSLEAAIRTRNL